MKFWVFVPCFDGPDLLAECLDSIRAQDDPDFKVVVADDASTDPAMRKVLDRCSLMPGWRVIRRRENVGATRNLVEAIEHVERTDTVDPDDVFLLVDGDDWLAHPGVLSRLRQVYEGTDTLISWGSYEAVPDEAGCEPARPLPPDILRYGMVRAFTRDHGGHVNHPLSFRRRCFDVLRADDFTFPDGTWMRHAYDTVLSVPMVEAAGERVAYVDDQLYCYRSDRPESVHRVHQDEANRENQHVLSQPRKYQPLEW